MCHFYSLSQPHRVTASHPSPGDNHQSTGGRSERHGHMKVIQLLMYQGSPLFPIFRSLTRTLYFHCSPRAPSHHPSNLTSVSLVAALLWLLAIRYSSILSTCPNHLNTLWSALLANYISIPALLRTSLFQTYTHSWHSNQTSQTLHLKNILFPSLSTSHTPCLCSVQAVGTINPSYRHLEQNVLKIYIEKQKSVWCGALMFFEKQQG